MKYLPVLMLLVALPVSAAEPKPAPNPENARQACKAVERDAVRRAKLQSPTDVTKVQRDAFDNCMRAKGVHTRVPRAK